MADYWDSNLQYAEIQGIAFDCTSRVISGGFDVGRHRYQFRRGQETEPTGGLPLTIAIEIPLFGDDYPIKYNQLIAVLTDEAIGGQIDFVDQLFGPMSMQVLQWSAREAFDRRAGAVLTVNLEERSTEQLDLTVSIAVQRGSAQAVAAGRAADLSLPSLGVIDETIALAFSSSGYPLTGPELDFPVGGVFAGMAQSVIDTIDTSTSTVDAMRGIVDTFRARIEAMLELDELRAIEAWSERQDLILLLDAVQRAALDAISLRGVEATFSPRGPVLTAHNLAQRIYGDASRWTDVVASNGAVRNPLLLGRSSNPLRLFLPKRSAVPNA